MIFKWATYIALFVFSVECFSGDYNICNSFKSNNEESIVLSMNGNIYVVATTKSIQRGRVNNSDSATAKVKISRAFDNYMRKREKWDYLEITTHGAISYVLKCGESNNFVTQISLKDISVKKLKKTDIELVHQNIQDLNLQELDSGNFNQFR